MANLGYKVVQYDASIPKAPYNHPNITFIKKFVGAKSEGDFISFEHVISSNAINKNAHNILQCDIEDFEWEILESIDLAMVADYFSQVLFEFHNCDPNDLELTNRRLKVLESLREHYSPIHLHFNNFGKGYYSEGLFWCETIEVSYMRNDLIPKDSKLKYGSIKLMGVDAANAEGYPDIPIIFKKP